jgi:hypothetical protein
MNPILGRILFGVFSPPRRSVSRHRPHVDEETRASIVEGEHARVTAWALERGFAERGIAVDSGCAGSSPRGVEITLGLRGLVTEPLLLSAKLRVPDQLLDSLFDDYDLDGALRAIALTPESVTLRFFPFRSTDVCDLALRRVEESLERAHLPQRVLGEPYR